MIQIKNELAVGILFFVAMIILGYFTIVMKEDFFSAREYYTLKVEFPMINGLKRDDGVKILGVPSGNVAHIELQDNKVLVVMRLYNNCTLYENFSMKIRSESMLGGKYIAINPGTQYEGDIAYGVVDKTQVLQGTATGDLFAVLEDVVSENREDIRETIRNFRNLTENFNQIAQKINRGEGTLGKLVNEDDLHEGAGDLVTELRETIEDTREQAPITSFIRAALTAL